VTGVAPGATYRYTGGDVVLAGRRVTVGIEDYAETQARLALTAAAERLESEFEGIYDRPEIERLLDGAAKDFSGRGVESFVAILAERFTRERLQARARGEGKLEKANIEVLFVSLTGGGRAQIGAAMLAQASGSAVTVHTAGSEASADVDATVREAMAEIGIDLTEEFTRPLTPEVLGNADIVVTMGRSVGDFDLPARVRHLDWRVGDPAGASLEEIRRVREDIGRRVTALAEILSDGA
jgi:arsenate reductase (thioredoxin)